MIEFHVRMEIKANHLQEYRMYVVVIFSQKAGVTYLFIYMVQISP